MKVLTVIFSIFLFYEGSSQNNQPFRSAEIQYGYTTYLQNYCNSINNFKNFEPGHPLQITGIIITTHGEKKTKVRTYGYLNQVIPQPVLINDSISGKITGTIFGLAAGRDIFSKRENFDLLVCFGYNIGVLKIYNNALINQRNFLGTIKGGLRPRVLINKIVLSFLVEYEYDYTKPVWKRSFFSGGNKIKMDNFWHTGMNTFLSVGYKFKD